MYLNNEEEGPACKTSGYDSITRKDNSAQGIEWIKDAVSFNDNDNPAREAE